MEITTMSESSEIHVKRHIYLSISLATFFAWMIESYSYNIMFYSVKARYNDFGMNLNDIGVAIAISSVCRTMGAQIFGMISNRLGRKRPFLASVTLTAVLTAICGKVDTRIPFMVMNALVSLCAGGQFGISVSWLMESVPALHRGLFAGIYMQGYATGLLMAEDILIGLTENDSWRNCFYFVLYLLLPVFCVAFIPESSVWQQIRTQGQPDFHKSARLAYQTNAPVNRFSILLLSFIAFFSSASRDLYPDFLQIQLKFSQQQIVVTTAVGYVGGFIGAIVSGLLLYYTRPKVIIGVCAFLSAALAYPWTFAQSLVAASASLFIFQFFVQGLLSAIPVYLFDVIPPLVRAHFIGIVFQLTRAIGSSSRGIESAMLNKFKQPNGTPNYGLSQIMFLIIAAACTMVFVIFAPATYRPPPSSINDESVYANKPTAV